MSDFEVTSAVEADTAVVTLAGVFDLHSREELKAALLTAVDAAPRTHVDLAAVRFLDSSGLHALVSAQQAAQKRNRIVYVTNATGAVARILEITGIIELLRPPQDSGPTATGPTGRDG